MVNACFWHVYGAKKRIFAACKILIFCKGDGVGHPKRPPTSDRLSPRRIFQFTTYSVSNMMLIFSCFKLIQYLLKKFFCFSRSFSSSSSSSSYGYKKRPFERGLGFRCQLARVAMMESILYSMRPWA